MDLTKILNNIKCRLGFHEMTEYTATRGYCIQSRYCRGKLHDITRGKRR